MKMLMKSLNLWGFFLCSDPQPGPDDQRSNQVATDGVTSADDLNLPGEYRWSFHTYQILTLADSGLLSNMVHCHGDK